ncbi:hypothetical protein ACVWXO_003473 [Bradyrhizobium sp. LM2.7]
MNFPAFKHRCLFSTECFNQLYIYIGKALTVLRKKPRQHTLDRVRWCGDFQHSLVAAPKDLRVFADSVEIGHYAAAICEKLLAFCG